MVSVLPVTKNLTGSDLSGSDGTANRTYTITGSSLYSITTISVNGTSLAVGVGNDFLLTGQIITFLNIIDNADIIIINYFDLVASPSTSLPTSLSGLRYASTEQLNNMLGITECVPTWEVGKNPCKENVGLGDDSTTSFYLDHRYIIAETYTIYSGSTETSATALTDLTHYTLAKDTGEITLTTAGVTQVGTDTVYAEYCYNDMFKDSYLNQVLLRAEKQVDSNVNTTFTDGTADNPDYPSITELQPSLGNRRNEYFTDERPLIDISSVLGASITASDTTLTLTTGDGVKFPSTGTIVIGEEKITYAGVSSDTLTGLSRGVSDSAAVIHAINEEIHTTVIEVSGTYEGTAPTWYIQEWNAQSFTTDTGKIFIYDSVLNGTVVTTSNLIIPLRDVENRLRFTYLHGYNTIPIDITRLTIILAKRQLIQDNIGKAMIQGRNEFSPEMFNVDQIEIDRIIGFYQVLGMGNT